MGLPQEAEGPVVMDVKTRTPAARAGLQVGDVIKQVNQSGVSDVDDLRNAVKRAAKDDPDRPVVLLVQRGQVTFYVAVDPQGK